MNIGKLIRHNSTDLKRDKDDTKDEALNEREDHFRELIECSLDAIVILNRDSTIRYKSAAFENMLGFQPQTHNNRSLLSQVHPDNLQQTEHFISKLLKNPGVSEQIAIRIQHRNKSWLWVEIKGTNSLDNPVIEGIVIYIRDVTEKKKAQEQLKLAEENYTTLFENSAVAITVIDENENIISWNKYTESLFGMKRDDLYMKPVSCLYPEDSWNNMRAHNLRQKGLQHHLETNMRTKNGDIIDVDLSLSMFKGPEGKIVGTIGIITDITERKQAQQQLKKVEAHYETIFDNTAVAITLADEKENIVSWNKFAEILFGMDKNDLYMKPVRSLYPENEWQRIREQNIRQKGMHNHLETKMIKKNREIIDVDISISVLKGTDGQITGSIAIISDITERKQKQERLEIIEASYQTLFENTAVAITVTNKNENIISWNKYAEVLLGMDKNDLYLKPIGSLYPIAEWEMIRAQDIRKKGMQNHLETKMIRKNGKIIDVDLSVSVLRGTGGEITGSIGIITDITDYKRTCEELQITRENLQTLFENSAVAITVADENEKIISWNKYAEVLLGMDGTELNTRPIKSLYPEEEWQRIRAENIRQKGMHNHFETKIIRKNGDIVDVDLSISVLKGTDGKITGSIGVISNISELKRVEEEKYKIEQELQLAGRLAVVGELAAGVAHELNNPLSAVSGYAQLLATKKVLDESIRKDLEIIYHQAQRATQITNNLLSFARSYKTEKGLVSINDIAENSLKQHEYLLQVNKIEVIMELEPTLPKIMADASQIEQIFINIISNAEQAMTEQNGKGKLLVKTQTSDKTIRISFADNGPGIPDDYINNIFDPFFTTKDVGKGTGLGLSICYGLVKEHNGALYVMNNIEGGATFVIELPICVKGSEVADNAGV